MADPISVPNSYTPNTDLTWVQKATHIWALHPTAPLKADKGGIQLESVISAPTTPAVAAPTPLGPPENTIEFHGGGVTTGTAANSYRTIAPFVFGDNPDVAGEQTPPVIGAASCWVYFYTYPAGNFARLIGQFSASHSPVLVTTSTGLLAGYVNSLTFYGTATPLNTWTHLAITNNATNRRLYLNGAKVAESAQDSLVGYSLPFEIGYVEREGGANYGVNGRLRLVAVINGAEWTDAEILEQYSRPFGYYAKVRANPLLLGVK